MNRQAKRFATIVAHPSGRLTGAYPTSLPHHLNSTFGGTSDMPQTSGEISLYFNKGALIWK